MLCLSCISLAITHAHLLALVYGRCELGDPISLSLPGEIVIWPAFFINNLPYPGALHSGGHFGRFIRKANDIVQGPVPGIHLLYSIIDRSAGKSKTLLTGDHPSQIRDVLLSSSYQSRRYEEMHAAQATTSTSPHLIIHPLATIVSTSASTKYIA